MNKIRIIFISISIILLTVGSLHYFKEQKNVSPKIESVSAPPIASCDTRYPQPTISNLPNNHLKEYIHEVKRYGIVPINNKKQLKRLIQQQALVPVPVTSYAYSLKIKDPDMKYVTPATREMLYQISAAFKNAISQTEVFNARLKVTCLLRYKNNDPKNSSKESAHKFGCAIDISYIEFLNDQDDAYPLDNFQLNFLQLTLEKVIEEFQINEKVYKTKEFGVSSKCFHLVPRIKNFNITKK